MTNNIEELFKRAGGSVKVALTTKAHQYTVERWRKQGIPHKYWELLIKTYDLTPAELHVMNLKIHRRARREARAK